MYITVIAPEPSQKKLFVGKVLKVVEERVDGDIAGVSLQGESFNLTKNQYVKASDHDIQSAFISISGGWLLKKGGAIVRLKKVENPILHFEGGAGKLEDFIPATDDIILKEKIEHIKTLFGYAEDSRVVLKEGKEGKIVNFSLNNYTKELVITILDDIGNYHQKKVEDIVQKK
ncbi:MAG: hypothetical protein M0R03_11020 [Novosphingobium sp.]|nr:hypothetical protein [Novosphingobium sp.]